MTRVGITLGEVVDTGRDAITVADPTRVLVLASLYGPDIARVKAGDEASVESPVPGHPPFEGRVRSVNAALDPTTNTAPARIELANPEALLRANMFVSVTVAADLGRDGVTVPAASIQQTEQGPIAFVRVAPDRFARRPVTLGIQRSDWVEVKSGIASGDSVATAGSFGLKAILLRGLLGSTGLRGSMKTWFALLVRRRLLVLMVALAAAAGGVANLEGLSIDAVPDISPKQVMVLTLSPGLGPLEVERLVTFPVENALGGGAGADQRALHVAGRGLGRLRPPSTTRCRSPRRGRRCSSACPRPRP